MADLKEKYGNWALVTGASSGIGAEFARQLAESGINLVLVARRRQRLEELAGNLKSIGSVQVRIIPVDLASDDFLPTIRKATSGLEIGILVNNAGFCVSGDFLDNDIEREQEMLTVNCLAPMRLAHEFGLLMKRQRQGCIIFVSSITGFTVMPGWSNYSATKAYTLLLGEGLAHELRGSGVDVHILCPGATRTEFHAVAGTKEYKAMEPDRVVTMALKKLGRKTIVIPGRRNVLLVSSARLLPRRWNVAVRSMIVKRLQG